MARACSNKISKGNAMNTDNAINVVKYLIAEYEEEKHLRIKYQEALVKIAHYDIQDINDLEICQKIARSAIDNS